MNSQKTGKVILSFIVAATMVSAVSNSSGQQRMRMTPEERTSALKDSLALDSTQTARVLVIFKEQQEGMSKIFGENQGDREAMRTAMTDLRKKTDEKIKAVLTDTQKAKYDEMIKNRPMGGMRGRGGN